MNGVHDMGGMHGMGPIQYERNEPVFHEPWEGRIFALNRAMSAWRKWNIDADWPHATTALCARQACTIHRDHGVHVFPDTNADFLGENPRHLYSVRFAARELWGEQASSRDAVYLDVWEDYIECA